MLSKPQAICIILPPVTLPSTPVNTEGRKNIVDYFSISFLKKIICLNHFLVAACEPSVVACGI